MSRTSFPWGCLFIKATSRIPPGLRRLRSAHLRVTWPARTRNNTCAQRASLPPPLDYSSAPLLSTLCLPAPHKHHRQRFVYFPEEAPVCSFDDASFLLFFFFVVVAVVVVSNPSSSRSPHAHSFRAATLTVCARRRNKNKNKKTGEVCRCDECTWGIKRPREFKKRNDAEEKNKFKWKGREKTSKPLFSSFFQAALVCRGLKGGFGHVVF